MKKIVIFTLCLVIAFSGVQAQKKKNTPKETPNAPAANYSDGAVVGNGEFIDLPFSAIGLQAPLEHAFKERRSTRDMREEEIPNEMLSSLLWSAYGFNRLEEQKRVVPSAANMQEFDIYVFTREGIYLYNAEKSILSAVVKGDHRAEISKQKVFATTPLSIVLVANYDRMGRIKNIEDRDFYAAIDAGYISQNIYLFCAAADLGTVACANIDREAIHKLLGIKNGYAIIAHPIGLK